MADCADGEICIVVATGKTTFACSHSPLRAALNAHRGALRILILQRDCLAYDQRIRELAGDELGREASVREEFADALDSATDFFISLAKKPPRLLKSIEVRAYDRPAIWKLVITTGHIWLQHYIPKQPADDSPAYVLRRGIPGGLASPLDSVFEFRWSVGADKVLLHRDQYDRRVVWPDERCGRNGRDLLKLCE
jgi:hypothetical protein